MLIIIAGAGRIGVGLAKNLRSENRDVVLLDNSAAAVKSAQSIDALVLHGDVMDRANSSPPPAPMNVIYWPVRWLGTNIRRMGIQSGIY